MVALYTVATSEAGYFKTFYQSCRANGFTPHVLGFGQPWQGYTWRLSLLQQALESADPQEIVVFCDAYDIVCIRSQETLLKRFLQFPARLVVGKHMDHPLILKLNELVFGPPCMNNGICAGFYMGYVDTIQEMIRLLLQERQDVSGILKNDDQFLLTSICAKHKDFFLKNVMIDEKMELVYTAPLSLTKQCSLPPTIQPCFIHCPGNQPMSTLIRSYGYNVGPDVRPQNLTQRVLYYIKILGSRYTFTLSVLLLIVLVLIAKRR